MEKSGINREARSRFAHQKTRCPGDSTRHLASTPRGQGTHLGTWEKDRVRQHHCSSFREPRSGRSDRGAKSWQRRGAGLVLAPLNFALDRPRNSASPPVVPGVFRGAPRLPNHECEIDANIENLAKIVNISLRCPKAATSGNCVCLCCGGNKVRGYSEKSAVSANTWTTSPGNAAAP